ncbi:uncharacterized protein [Montipora foliosa]|uniref:uncharacterized protein n=1 Tax=Montipora foliosa TaxID=591990 RepID=UPI0035F1B868
MPEVFSLTSGEERRSSAGRRETTATCTIFAQNLKTLFCLFFTSTNTRGPSCTDHRTEKFDGSKKWTYQRVSQWFRKQGGDNRRIESTILGTSKVFESKGDKDYDPWLERLKLSAWFRTTQSKPDTKQDSKATGFVQEKHKMTDKPQNGKNRALLPTTRRVVSQVNVMKTLLASYKRNTDFKSEYVTIEFAKRPEDRAIDMGFLLHGGVDCSIIPGDSGIFVKHVIAGSVADKKLSPGDRILSINGLNVTKVKLTCAQQAVRRAQGMVRLYIKKAPNRQKIIYEAIKKENRRDSSPFSDEDIEDYEDAFSVYDVKGKGNIRVNDVFPLIRSLGHNPLEAAVWCYMNELGLTGKKNFPGSFY